MSQLTANIYFDGGTANSNPGNIKTSVLIEYFDSELPPEIITNEYDVIGTNNEAEWLSAFHALIECENREIFNANFYGDSKMVINVINGEYQQKKKHLKKIFDEFSFQRSEMNEYNLNFTWIPREKNISGWAISESVMEQNKLSKYLEKRLTENAA